MKKNIKKICRPHYQDMKHYQLLRKRVVKKAADQNLDMLQLLSLFNTFGLLGASL